MKKMCKVIIALLINLMLVSNICYVPVLADEPPMTEAQKIAELEKISNRATEIGKSIFNVYTADISKIGQEDARFTYGDLGESAFNIISGFTTIGFSILKMSGAINVADDPIVSLRKHLDNRLDGIDQTLRNFDSNLDRMQNSINQSFSKVGDEIDKISTTLDQNNITSVDLIYSKIKNEIDNFEPRMASYIMKWYKAKGYNEDLYVDYIADDQGKINTIIIPGELITEAFIGVGRWNPNKKEDLITTVFINVLEKAENDQVNYGDFWNEYNDVYGTVVPTDTKNKFAKAAYDALRCNCMVDIALEGNYIATLIGDFNSYCNYLSEKDGKYVSPLRSRYNMFEKIFAFQGELDCVVENYSVDTNGVLQPYNTNLANITMQEYFAQLSDVGAYVAEMAIASDCYSDDELNKLIYTPWASAEVIMNKTYENFYHKTKNGEPINNYCYITDSVIEYSNENLTADMYCKYENWYNYEERILNQHQIDVTKKELQKDLSFSVDSSIMVNNNELTKIYAYYQAEKLRDTQNTYDETFGFYQYLNSKKVYKDSVDINELKNSFISPLIVTNYVGSQDFGSADSATMVGEMYAQTYLEKYPNHQSAGEYVGSNYKEIVTGSSPNFIIRKKAVADTFDALTGKPSNNKNIGSVAMYYEDKREDEVALLWDIDYIGTKYIVNPDALDLRMDPTKAKNKLSAGIVENYIDEARQFIAEPGYEYKSFPNNDVKYGEITGRTDKYASWSSHKVHYKRHYGTIIKNSADVYATNERISKTNTIEIKNDIKLSNNYIPTLSFTDTNQELNSQFINETTEIQNTRTNAKTKFVNTLQTLGYGQADIEKLKLNDTYSISFNNSNCLNVDKETYNKMVEKMINYLNPSSGNVGEMANKYKTLIENISSVVDIANVDNNQTGVALSRDKISELLVNYLKDLTGVENPSDLVVKDEIPTTNVGKFVYCKSNGMLYKWNGANYITDDTPSKTKVLDVNKLGNSYRLVNSRNVTEVTSNPNGSTNYQGDLLKYNESFYYWNEKIDEPRAEHVGTYVEYTNLTDSSTVPVSKTKDYVYCTSNNEYYEWKNGIDCYYVEINPVEVVSLDVYKDDVVKYDGKFYQWNRDISPKAYEIVKESNGDPTTLNTSTYTYVSYNDKCYKWICYEGYVELAYDTLAVAPTDSTQYVKDYVKYGNDYYMWVVENTEDTDPSHGKYIEAVGTVDEDVTEDEYTNLGSNAVPNQRVSNDAKGYMIKTNGKYYCWYSDLVESGKYKKINVGNSAGNPTGGKTTYYIYDSNAKLYHWSNLTPGKYVPVSKEKLEKVGLIVNTDINLTTEENKKAYIGMYVKSTFDNKYYIWNESTDTTSPSNVAGKYEQYTGATIVVLENDELPTSGEHNITSSGNIEIYPKSTTTDIKLVYQVKPVISFELYFDKEIKTKNDVDNANINYNVIPYFEVVPVITWSDAGTQRHLEINDEALKNANIGLIPIKIPILDDDKIENVDSNDNTALVYHFDSLEQTLVPSEQFNTSIYTNNGIKYTTVYARTFSPFVVKKTYLTFDPPKKYIIPKTGI